ncbi:MAG: YeeE/YedE thiosulfate transporter family protein [Candidatus Marinimicrobia bacterium]|nr:YeeE/YedE thiosulfate transporter family protein [Candidatus Neomarinimicrobiota bacterium]
MGPLVPQEIIGADWNLFIAFVIGIGFGFALEQAGFSSSRKLAGMFYGYDTVVLKVFFTGAITAMLGLLFFSLFGWIDLSLIYVNPTFLWSAIAGGAIMGAGFIIGGFCPGTSFCAAAIGKIDAMVFIGGIFLGIFFFAEGYPLLKDFYMAGSFGPLKVSDFLGISGGVMTFLVIIAALVMFKLGELAEKKWPREEY